MGGTARITFLSRGATDFNRTGGFGSDQPLGEAARAALGEALPAMRIASHILCAPEKSARETAALLGRDVTVDPALADLDYGGWTGRTIGEIAGTDPAGLQSWIDDPQSAPHGGEPIAQLHARVRQWLESRAGTSGRLLAVTHQPIIRSIVLNVLEAPLASFWKIDIAYGTLTEITHDGRRWSLRSVNRPAS